MIELKDFSVGYGGKAVVRNVSICFPLGQVTILLGPNGSGKSTLLKGALGLLPPMDGGVFYDGVDIKKLSRKEIARQAAFLTQSRNTPSIQALKMVLHGRFPYLSYPRRSGAEDYEIARKAMDDTGCREHENANIFQLSGGQRQGVYLAMALAQDTQTVFMDEPTTYLDVNRQLQMMQTARDLARQGKAVVLVLHDLSLALRYGDRIAVLDEGKLLAFDGPEGIMESGVLDRAFQVEVHRMDTPHGPQYYCVGKEG